MTVFLLSALSGMLEATSGLYEIWCFYKVAKRTLTRIWERYGLLPRVHTGSDSWAACGCRIVLMRSPLMLGQVKSWGSSGQSKRPSWHVTMTGQALIYRA